jgi:hypothetical protein
MGFERSVHTSLDAIDVGTDSFGHGLESTDVASGGPVPAIAGSGEDADGRPPSASERAYDASTFEIEDEFRVLYRGDSYPPEQVFTQGLQSRAERLRESHELAADASPFAVLGHLGRPFQGDGPFVSTSASQDIATGYARRKQEKGNESWLYVIRTNRGIAAQQRAQRSREDLASVPGIKDWLFWTREMIESKAATLQEILIPASILPSEVAGAWTVVCGRPYAFLPNPAYKGPDVPPTVLAPPMDSPSAT